jgi:SAM-dependent methyltransferase
MCRSPLGLSDGQIACGGCGASYPLTPDGRPDLRLRGRKPGTVEYQLGDVPLPDVQRIGPIPENPEAQLAYRSVAIPWQLTHGNRLTRALLSHFPRAASGGAAMLDLGCGEQIFRDICAHTGFEYIGIDYDGPGMVLGDAHALPFKDDAFDFVISFAVLEHLRYPSVGLREAWRVLKPGCPFIGTVAFLEPFHLNSYYHTSPLGTYDLLAQAGFEVRHLEANKQWQGLRAQAEMSLFPHSPRLLADLIVLPLHLLSRLWWKLGYLVERRFAASENARRMTNTAGFRWVCTKPPK